MPILLVILLIFSNLVGVKTIITIMITESKVIEIFCIADDFCKEFDIEVAKKAIRSTSDAPKRRRKRMMSDAEVITILICFHFNSYRNLFANSMWANSQTMTSASDYASVSNVLDKYYAAESRILDFGKSDVLSLINGWCSDKTKGLIPEFLKEAPSNQTQSMVINTLYFDCAWKQPFPKTKSDAVYDFYDEDGQRRCGVHMMSNNIDVDYVQSDICSAIRIPYADCNYSAIFALPRSGNGIKNTTKDILPSLKQMLVSKAFDRDEHESVKVYLPRMTIESSGRIDKYICNNGIDLKNKKLLGFDRGNPIGIQQATFLSLYEEGTRVASVTSSDMGGAPSGLMFNQPFVMIIRDNNTGSIVLMAVVRMPKE